MANRMGAPQPQSQQQRPSPQGSPSMSQSTEAQRLRAQQMQAAARAAAGLPPLDTPTATSVTTVPPPITPSKRQNSGTFHQANAQDVRQQQQQKSQKQEMQQTAEDHNKAQKEAKRKNEAELQKLADKMGEGAAFRAGDQKARQRVRKRKIAQEGGGETVKGGIAFSDGSALFVSPNISGEDFTNMRKMVRGIK